MNPPTNAHTTWRKSTHSGQQANCLEWQQASAAQQIALRDSKSGAHAPHLTIPHPSWLSFVDALADRT
ncbi:DUF397 domain-containing protein [Yinghuangia sp. ASG 101]|uniref:DUF397 domain-containing protein n=1 Tax=Yinghuangia sp. ASG 101 TaxID=2896848 RepID=UPI001E33E181|nr:DUF397 domain-containing protein [Yinghuangia sp. ASG 101]UGQ14782.1 DUF397 domain-containing protein [Yinghuangia sp. ASG 101]